MIRNITKPKVAFTISEDKAKAFTKEINKADAPTAISSIKKVNTKLEMLYGFYKK